MPAKIAGLYAIADTRYLEHIELLPAVRAALEGGARIIQYRDKSSDVTRREHDARVLASVCRDYDALFLINDDVTLAENVGAHGVHIGRDDTPLALARQRLGPGAVIGVSCYNDPARAVQAQDDGADYVAFGSFFASRTKPQAVHADTDMLQRARSLLHIPIVAIGGITPQNGADLIDAGADALAAIEGVFGQADPRAAAARYARLFTQVATSFISSPSGPSSV
jgi:thiamine-phosphate pyrophosphorylase